MLFILVTQNLFFKVRAITESCLSTFTMTYSAYTENYAFFCRLILKDGFFSPCYGWFRVLGRIGRAESNSSWVWTDCSIFYPQIKPNSPNTNLMLHKWVRGDVLKHQEFTCALVIPWSGKLSWKEISGKKPLVNPACCWRLHKSLLQIRVSYVLCLSPQPLMLSTGSEKCQNSGGEGGTFFAISQFLKPLLHQARGRERK